jgi:hypothetical protein
MKQRHFPADVLSLRGMAWKKGRWWRRSSMAAEKSRDGDAADDGGGGGGGGDDGDGDGGMMRELWEESRSARAVGANT